MKFLSFFFLFAGEFVIDFPLLYLHFFLKKIKLYSLLVIYEFENLCYNIFVYLVRKFIYLSFKKLDLIESNLKSLICGRA